MIVYKKKHCWKVEHKGQVRYSTQENLEKVKKELLALDGKQPEETSIYL